MAKLQVFVCSHFAPEFARVHGELGFDDVELQVFAASCLDRQNQASVKTHLEAVAAAGDEAVLIAGQFCGAVRLAKSYDEFRVMAAESCHNHLIPESLARFITVKGGYLIGSGWLQNWERNLADMGFDQETARAFYRDSCQELVFFHTGVVEDAETRLTELSRYVERPFTIINWELQSAAYLFKSLVYEWRIRQLEAAHTAELREAQTEGAEYASIMDFMGRIASNVTRRDMIGRIKELFQMVLGAQSFDYWSAEAARDDLPEEAAGLLDDPGKTHVLSEDGAGFYLKVHHRDTVFGILGVGDFLFPQYLPRYLNFVLNLAPVCGLTLANIAHYETLRRTQDELRYLSYHDALTGLYNRAYVQEVMAAADGLTNPCVFSFDLNGLKLVNDTYGHAEGDQLIQGAAELLKSRFRETDVVARVGGDEFVAIVEECGPAWAERRLEEIRTALAVHNRSARAAAGASGWHELGIAIGYACAAGRDVSLEELTREADAAMYADKARQRD